MNNSDRVERPSKSEEELTGLPFPKKILAAINTVQNSVAQKNPPRELARLLNKIAKNAGHDYIADHGKVFAPLRKRFEEEFGDGSVADGFAYSAKVINKIMCDNPTFSATLPIALERFHTDRLEVIGSCVLIRIAKQVFLLTAAHVADRREDGDLLIPGKNGFRTITGNFLSGRLPASGNRNDDKLDIALCRLSDACAADLLQDRMILEHQNLFLEAPPFLRTDYTFAGFPWRKTNAKLGGVEATFSTMTGMDAKPSEYKAAGLNPMHHIAIRFHRRKTFLQRTRKVITSPLPHGMSGGGIYVWTEEALKLCPVKLPLVGIANTFLPDKSLLIGTRLHLYVQCILYQYVDIAASIFEG